MKKLSKQKIIAILIYSGFLGFGNRAFLYAQQQDVPEPVFTVFSIQPPYIPSYHGRDPFDVLGNLNRSPQVSISELKYNGVMVLGDTSIALFNLKDESSVRYTLKYRKLFKGTDEIVDGVIGDISSTEVMLFQGDQKIVYPRK
jgi:hypothetical protein